MPTTFCCKKHLEKGAGYFIPHHFNMNYVFMKKTFFLFQVFYVVVCFGLYGQGIITNEEASGEAVEPPQVNLLDYTLVEQTDLDLTVATPGAFINQVGDGNRVDLRTFGSNNGIVLDQRGNANRIDLTLSADRIDYAVLQNGNNNYLLEFNTVANKELLQRDIEQIGDGQNLVIHGQNGLIDKMKIQMTGSQSVIIRNTN